MAALQTTNEGHDELFSPPFFKKLNIQGYPMWRIKLKSDLVQQIKESIKTRGYNPDEPIIVAMSDDPKLNGRPIDGCNRLYGCFLVEKETGQLPKIKIIYENVRDELDYLAKWAACELRHTMSKTPSDAKENLHIIFQTIERTYPQLLKQQTLDEVMVEHGQFDNALKLKTLISEYEKIRKKRMEQDTANNNSSRQSGSNRSVAGDTSSVQSWAGGGTTEIVEGATTYHKDVEHKCAHCSKKEVIPVVVVVHDKGGVDVREEKKK